MEVNQVAIIGAGPAGITAALQLKRYGITPLLFEKNEVGGLLRNANLIENYPGFPGGVSGSQLVNLITQQLREAVIDVIYEPVLHLDFEGDTFLLQTTKQWYCSHFSVVASGTKPHSWTIPELSPEARSYVYDEVAPLSHVEGKKIVIVGAGDAAFDYALYLARANEVFILNRGTAVKCIPLLWDRAQAVSTIFYHPGVTLAQILKTEADSPVNLKCVGYDNGTIFWADYVIFAIGRDPQLCFLSENIRKCQEKLIAEGKLYLVGDVNHGIFRQTAIAVGDGLLAAMKLYSQMSR